MRRGALRAGIILLLLAVCAVRAPGGEIRDMVGRRVTVPAHPARLVSLAPSMTEIVYALGAGDRLVGDTDYCDYPAGAKTKPKVGGIYAPNFEVILSLKPDLVLATSEGNREEDVHALERLGIPVYVARPVDFVSVLESIVEVGGLLGEETEAARLVATMRDQADAVTRAIRGVRRPRVLYVLWGNPLIVAGRDTLITDLIGRAGGESITGDEALPYPRFSLEEVVARRPEWVILAQHGDATTDKRLREWRALTLLPAVRAGRVRTIDGDLVHRPGPRIVDGLRALARIFHPGRVP